MSLNPTDGLKLAREAYLASTTYFDASIRRQVEEDLRRAQGLHPAGSKYLSESGRGRSKLFRPKTRAALRKQEAIAAEAFFSTRDVVNTEPQDDNNEMQQASAEVMKYLLQHRLTKTIPWFQTVIGAYQDSNTVGMVCSYQHWVFDKKKKKDEPAVRLVPLENVRFDPGADWMDPVNTSPYFIELVPMYVKDVRRRMETNDPKTGEPKWKKLDDSAILTAVRGYSDSTRITREQGRTDPKEQSQSVTAYSIVWVHKNIVEHEGEDYCYYTLGSEQMLCDPVPLAERYWHGKRPYVIGCTVIETHKNYPSGTNRLGKDVQAEINDVANLRIDNVKLVLNKRYFAKRNKQVDLRSLTRNVPGSVTLMTDPKEDVIAQEFNDVTASSYKEQEVLNLDYDDVTGSFSGSSVQSNRKLNETVGGMQLLHVDANQMSGYGLMTFVETWMEPVLRQLVLLEQHYETDDVILALAGQKAKVFERFGIDEITDDLLMQELTLSVGVGMGATNPQEKVNRFLTALRALREVLSDGILQQHGIKFSEVAKEIFGNLGYRDGSRFFDTEGADPRVAELMQQIQALEQQLAAKTPPELVDAQIRMIDAQIAALEPKNKLAQAQAVKTGVDAGFAATQGAELIAAVPQIAPIADVIMQAAGYQLPDPAGVDPNFPQPAAQPVGAAASLAPPGGIPMAPSGGAPGDTSPNTPATAGTGARQGIETQEADSQGVEGMADGGLVGGYEIDPMTGLPITDMGPTTAIRPMARTAAAGTTMAGTPSAINSRAKMGLTINGLTDQTNAELGVNPLNSRSVIGSGQTSERRAFGSGLLGYADGGMIQGPGTGASDSIPAVNMDTGQPLAVSNGEFAVPPQVVQALGADFFEELIAKYHTPVEGQPAIYSGAAPVGLETGQMVIPADVVEALGLDFFEALVQKYAQ